MAVLHGKNFDAKWDGVQICETESWNFNNGGDTARYVSNKTGGRYSRVDGPDDDTATINLLQDSDTPLDTQFFKGATGNVELYENATLKWKFDCVVESVAVNAVGTDIVKYVVTLGATAAPTTNPSSS